MPCCFTSSKFYSNVTSSLVPSLTSLSPKLTIPISLGWCLFLIFCMCNYLHTTHFIHSVCIQLATWAEFKIVGFLFFFFLISSLLVHKILSGSMGVAYCTPMRRRGKSLHIHAEGTETLMVGWLYWSASWSHLAFGGDMPPPSFGICACSHETATLSDVLLLNQGSDIQQMCSEFFGAYGNSFCPVTQECMIYSSLRRCRLYKQCIMPQIPALLLSVFIWEFDAIS